MTHRSGVTEPRCPQQLLPSAGLPLFPLLLWQQQTFRGQPASIDCNSAEARLLKKASRPDVLGSGTTSRPSADIATEPGNAAPPCMRRVRRTRGWGRRVAFFPPALCVFPPWLCIVLWWRCVCGAGVRTLHVSRCSKAGLSLQLWRGRGLPSRAASRSAGICRRRCHGRQLGKVPVADSCLLTVY